MAQMRDRLFNKVVVPSSMGIERELKFRQSLDLVSAVMVNEVLTPVLRQCGSHSQLSSVVHQGPGHGGPLRPQQTEAGEGPDAALDESRASFIATKVPQLVHQSSVGDIQR